MLDIKFIKENKELIETVVKNKNRKVDLDLLISLSEERKNLRTQIDEINAKRNEAAKNRDQETGIRLKGELEGLETQFQKIDKEFVDLMIKVPNVYSPDTPIGPDESGNVVIRSWGEKPQFSFTPKDHLVLGEKLGLIDTEKAGAISGSRFAYIKGDLVLLQFGLLQYCLRTLTDETVLEQIIKERNLSVSPKPFIPVIPPVFIKPAVQNRMARFMTPEEHYMFPNDDLMLIGSAEHTLGPLHMDSIIEEKDLPIRYLGYSTAFRREAGSYGQDTKGILRQHQFDKLEMEVFSLPEQSLEEQELLVAIQEHIMQALKLPYQVVLICTGDMGFPDYRQIDIEAWLPGQDKYRETHSSDNIIGFQSRRLNTKVRRTDKSLELVHMNDATVFAAGRLLIAIMENYQREDGTIMVPEILKPYVGKDLIG